MWLIFEQVLHIIYAAQKISFHSKINVLSSGACGYVGSGLGFRFGVRA